METATELLSIRYVACNMRLGIGGRIVHLELFCKTGNQPEPPNMAATSLLLPAQEEKKFSLKNPHQYDNYTSNLKVVPSGKSASAASGSSFY